MLGRTVPAAACDHRYGATATWSQSTDTAQTNSFWWAEACAFRSNLAATVFDIPFHKGPRYVPMAKREAAARTGRLSFQVYFASDHVLYLGVIITATGQSILDGPLALGAH